MSSLFLCFPFVCISWITPLAVLFIAATVIFSANHTAYQADVRKPGQFQSRMLHSLPVAAICALHPIPTMVPAKGQVGTYLFNRRHDKHAFSSHHHKCEICPVLSLQITPRVPSPLYFVVFTCTGFSARLSTTQEISQGCLVPANHPALSQEGVL